MSSHTAHIDWENPGGDFLKFQYSRAHHWTFDGGQKILASSSPHAVRLPFSDPAGVDPEEAFVAALSACHMLTFLYYAGKGGFVVQSYDDPAEGTLAKTPEGRMAITKVTLKPLVIWTGKEPSRAELDHLHHKAHEDCFIANSVKTDITVEPRFSAA